MIYNDDNILDALEKTAGLWDTAKSVLTARQMRDAWKSRGDWKAKMRTEGGVDKVKAQVREEFKKIRDQVPKDEYDQALKASLGVIDAPIHAAERNIAVGGAKTLAAYGGLGAAGYGGYRLAKKKGYRAKVYKEKRSSVSVYSDDNVQDVLEKMASKRHVPQRQGLCGPVARRPSY